MISCHWTPHRCWQILRTHKMWNHDMNSHFVGVSNSCFWTNSEHFWTFLNMVPLISSATELHNRTHWNCNDQGNLRIVLQAKLLPWKGLLERSRLQESEAASPAIFQRCDLVHSLSNRQSHLSIAKWFVDVFGLAWPSWPHLWQSHHTPQNSEQLALAPPKSIWKYSLDERPCLQGRDSNTPDDMEKQKWVLLQ